MILVKYVWTSCCHKIAVVIKFGEKTYSQDKLKHPQLTALISQETSLMWPQILFQATPPKFNIEQEVWKIRFLYVLIVFGIFRVTLARPGPEGFTLTMFKKLAQWPADINKRWKIRFKRAKLESEARNCELLIIKHEIHEAEAWTTG